MKKAAIWMLLPLLTIGVSQLSVSQVGDVGVPSPFSSVSASEFDTVDNVSLNVHFAIPIVQVRARGTGVDFAVHGNTNIWQIVYNSALQKYQWQAFSPYGGYLPAQTSYYGWVFFQAVPRITYQFSTVPCGSGTAGWYRNFQVTDPGGATHPFGLNYRVGGVCTSGATGAYAYDGSGYYMNGATFTAYSPAGTKIEGAWAGAGAAPPSKATDSNGNFYTLTTPVSGETDLLDSSGRTLLKALSTQDGNLGLTSVHYQVAAPNGGTADAFVNFAYFNVQTNFGCPNVLEAAPTQVSLPTSIQLPNATSYAFQYDTTGRLSRVTSPTGAIYTYSYPGSNQGVLCLNASGGQDGELGNLTHTITDGTRSVTDTYVKTFSNNQTIVTKTRTSAPAPSINSQSIYTIAAGGNVVLTCSPLSEQVRV